MQAQTFSRKKLIGILVILGLLLALYFALKLARQPQELRKRAAGTGDILLTLDPTAKSAAKGEAFNVKIAMKNNASSPKTISTSGVDLDFDPALFTVTALSCGSNFPSAAVSRVDTAAKKIYLTCFVGAGSSPYSMAAGSQTDLGSFTLTVGSSVPTTSTDISFARTNVADSATYADLSNPGTKATYNVGVTSPTISPTPPNTTVTPTPTPTDISDDFSGESLNNSLWNTYASPSYASATTKQESGVLRATIDATQSFYRATATDFQNKMTGDFTATVDLNTEQSGTPFGADTQLIFHDDSWVNSIYFSLRKIADGSFQLIAGAVANSSTNDYFTLPLSNGPITVKLQRIGSTVNYYYKNNSSQFVLLGTKDGLYSGDGRIALHANSWTPNFPSLTATFDNFNISYYSTITPTPSPTVTPTFGTPQTSSTISDNFDGANLDNDKWTIIGTESNVSGLLVQSGGKLVGTTGQASSDYKSIGVLSKGPFTRDLSVETTVSNLSFVINPTDNTKGGLARLYLVNASGDYSDLGLSWVKHGDGLNQIRFGNSSTDFATLNVTGNPSSIKMKLQRIGSLVLGFIDQGSGYQLVGTAGIMADPFNFKLVVLTYTGSGANTTASFDDFSALVNLIPIATPTLTPTLTPTPPSGQEAYTIDIGTKAVLSINIGSGNTPQIKFTAKLAGAEGHPDMYMKLRAKDDLAFVDNPNSGPTCESPGVGGVDLYVPMKADNSGIYTPVTGINISAPAGAVVAPVSADGWVSLIGLSAGKYYTLNLKGSKTRGTEMLKHVLLAGGQSASQNYDWTDNSLQPGDIPDPNNSNKQDCTVNSVDISLINSRLGKTDTDSLNIADVSYDGVVNANDIAQVVGTLSTKPDDDN